MNSEYFIYINLDGFGKYYYDVAKEAKVETPNLDSLIDEGVFFEELYTGVPSITFPMQSSILSGGYSDLTDNCFQYFDKDKGKLLKCNHNNAGQTIGDVLQGLNQPFISVQQFGLKDKGCSFDDEKFVYFQPGGNFKKRFNLLQDIITGRKVKSQKREYVFENIPEFIFFYADDLDALGHNPFYTDYDPMRVKALSEEDRIKSVIERLKEIDKEIGRLIKTLKAKGIYEKTTILITSDHGMIPYKGKSSLPKLIKKLRELGFKEVKLINEDSEKALNINNDQVLVSSTGIQCQLYLNNDVDLHNIKNQLITEEYVENCLTKYELKEIGVKEEFADLLVSPQEFVHFNLNLTKNFIFEASHDSLHEKCQKVFGVMKGPKVRKGVIYKKKAYNIDLIPTACTLLSLPIMKGSKGKILEDISI